MNRRSKFFAVALAIAGGVCLAAGAAGVTNQFGFSGKEIFPIDQQVSNLRVADLDGDGLNDLIVANNLHSKISLLYNLTGKTNRTELAPEKKLELKFGDYFFKNLYLIPQTMEFRIPFFSLKVVLDKSQINLKEINPLTP